MFNPRLSHLDFTPVNDDLSAHLPGHPTQGHPPPDLQVARGDYAQGQQVADRQVGQHEV